ncbi:MAG: hypothetical protein EP344_11015 [Bacteroidetes bacterium]|nr:MAG: hypothetical protein EP344_11015 [Bacteroidota bacterium]
MDTSKQKKRRPLWLRITLWTGLGTGLLLLLLVLVAAVFDKQITKQVLDQVRKNLKTELEVGDARLSLISGFPNASVDLRDVRLEDAFSDELLSAREVAFRFKLTSLFSGNIQVKDMRVSGGSIRVRITERGLANYDVFKRSAGSGTGSGGGGKPGGKAKSGMHIALENARLTNLLLSFQNAKTRQTAELVLHSAGFAGDFSNQQFNLSSQAELTVARLQLNDSRYLLGEKVRYNAVLAVDLRKNQYELQRVDLVVGGNTFAVEGSATDRPEYTDLNLKLLSKDSDVSVVFDLLPEPYHSYFNDFQSRGTYDFEGFIVGRASKTQTPTIGVQVALRDGQLSSEKLQSPLRNVSFRAVYSAPPDGTGVFEIADFKGTFGGEDLNFNLKIKNLDDPFLEFDCHGALPLAATYGLFNDPGVTGGDGLVRLNRLHLEGRYSDMTRMSRINTVQVGGEVEFDRAAIVYKDVPVQIQSGRIRLDDNLLVVSDLLLQAGNNDFSFRGNARNLLPVLFADSLNTADALLEFTAKLKARKLDVSQLIGLFSVQEKKEAVKGGKPRVDSLRTAGNVERQQLTDKLKGVFEASFDAFSYGDIQGSQFLGRLAFDHNQLVIKGDAQTMQGAVKLDGVAHFAISPTLKMRITARDIDLETCMRQCRNFGQDVITDANLRGTLSGRMVIWAFWDARNNLLMDRLRVYADISAVNGKLVGLKMLESFSTYAHIEDLRWVEFNDLQNYLEISNRSLYLPVMFIQNNALNLTLSGTHSFDNDIDYKIKVNVGQTIWNKMKGHGKEYEPLPQKEGWFNAYYSITGNLDKYEMVKGKEDVQAAFARSETRKQQIATVIDNEYKGIDSRPPRLEEDVEYLDPITGGQGRPGAVREEQ